MHTNIKMKSKTSAARDLKKNCNNKTKRQTANWQHFDILLEYIVLFIMLYHCPSHAIANRTLVCVFVKCRDLFK